MMSALNETACNITINPINDHQLDDALPLFIVCDAFSGVESARPLKEGKTALTAGALITVLHVARMLVKRLPTATLYKTGDLA